MSEHDLQRQVNEYLRKSGIRFLHIQKGRGTNRTQRKGVPDLIIWPGNGRTIFCELKSKIGKMTPDQIAFRVWSVTSGYSFLEARTFEEFFRKYHSAEMKRVL